MQTRIGDRLSPEILDYLRSQHPFVIITHGQDGWPCADVVSWILALDEQTIRMVVGTQRPTVANIRGRNEMTLQILGSRLSYEIKGTGQVIKERCESIRFPQAMVELKVVSIRENMYPANFVTGDVPVGWPETTDAHHHEWNRAIAEEMRTMIPG
jgi:hypothetical protein